MQLHLKYTILETLKYKKSIYFADFGDMLLVRNFAKKYFESTKLKI